MNISIEFLCDSQCYTHQYYMHYRYVGVPLFDEMCYPDPTCNSSELSDNPNTEITYEELREVWLR